MGEKRKCQATTGSGKPCSRTALEDGDYCIAHADKETRESKGFGGAQPGAGRKPRPRAIDVLKERVEADIDRVLKPLFDALEAEKSVVVGNGPTAHIETVPDIPTRKAAAAELLDRGYGRPKQTVDAIVVSDADLLERIALMEGELDDGGDSGVPGDDPEVSGD